MTQCVVCHCGRRLCIHSRGCCPCCICMHCTARAGNVGGCALRAAPPWLLISTCRYDGELIHSLLDIFLGVAVCLRKFCQWDTSTNRGEVGLFWWSNYNVHYMDRGQCTDGYEALCNAHYSLPPGGRCTVLPRHTQFCSSRNYESTRHCAAFACLPYYVSTSMIRDQGGYTVAITGIYAGEIVEGGSRSDEAYQPNSMCLPF